MMELYKELTTHQLPIDLRTDCQSLVDNINSLRVQVEEKRLTAEMWALRNAYTNGEIRDFTHVSTQDMIADGLTKDKPELIQHLTNTMKGFLLPRKLE